MFGILPMKIGIYQEKISAISQIYQLLIYCTGSKTAAAKNNNKTAQSDHVSGVCMHVCLCVCMCVCVF